MSHILYKLTVELASPLGTPLMGDTLFGQFCWVMRDGFGENELEKKLDGYCKNNPWVVLSDGFPSGYLPKPTLPFSYYPNIEKVGVTTAHKLNKKKNWIAIDDLHLPIKELLIKAKADKEVYRIDKEKKLLAPISAMQFHNKINRQTNTTGEDGFAPYSMPITYFDINQPIDIWCVIDEERSNPKEVQALFEHIGKYGYGRDASVGLGKFMVKSFSPANLPQMNNPNAYLTLANCSPQNQEIILDKSFWKITTRFGRHGNISAIEGKPFKNPILLATAGAVFSPKNWKEQKYFGQGLGGLNNQNNGLISKTQAQTVHQGYAPVLPICLE